MRVSLTNLERGAQIQRHRGPASEYFTDSEIFLSEILISSHLEREGGLLLVTLDVELEGHFLCDRCGETFTQPHRAHDDFFFTFEKAALSQDDPDVPVIPTGARELDLSQEIRDLVILGLPYQILCQEDCRGLCPQCGANWNRETCQCQTQEADPRWLKLQQLKNSSDS